MDTDEGLGRSQSLHDLYTESPIRHVKTASRNKYAFVESKVKQYRLNIQNQEREHKKRMLLEKLEHRSRSSHSSPEMNADSALDEKDKLLLEKEKMIDVLKGQLVEQIRLSSSYQVKVDSMRQEISRLKSRQEAHNSTNSGTPTSVRATHFNIFKTPIRTISRTLLSPFSKNDSKNITVDRVESFSDEESFENNSNDSSTVVDVPSDTFTVSKDRTKVSFTSTDVLMDEQKPRRKFPRNVMNLMFPCMTCHKSTKTIKMGNKVYPSLENREISEITIPEIQLTLITPN